MYDSHESTNGWAHDSDPELFHEEIQRVKYLGVTVC
jgi:hypothetical protein